VVGLIALPGNITVYGQHFLRTAFLHTENAEPEMLYTDLGQKIEYVAKVTASQLDRVLLNHRFWHLQVWYHDRPWRRNWSLAHGTDLEVLADQATLEEPNVTDAATVELEIAEPRNDAMEPVDTSLLSWGY
jgi:hypothetical protein